MINADEFLNITHLEDKLTVIFWRLVESNRLGNFEPVHKVSTDDFAKAYSNSEYSAAIPKCKECAIGSAEVTGFIAFSAGILLISVYSFLLFLVPIVYDSCKTFW